MGPRSFFETRDVDQVDARSYDVVERGAGLDKRLLDVRDRLFRLNIDISLADQPAILAPGHRARGVYRIAGPNRTPEADLLPVGRPGRNATTVGQAYRCLYVPVRGVWHMLLRSSG